MSDALRLLSLSNLDYFLIFVSNILSEFFFSWCMIHLVTLNAFQFLLHIYQELIRIGISFFSLCISDILGSKLNEV